MSQKWNSKVQFPTDSNFTNRVIGAEFGPAKSGTPMITLELEIVSPETVTIGTDEYTISGVKCKQYYTTESYTGEGETRELDEAGTAKRREAIKKLFETFELPSTDINWDNIDVKPFIGKVVYSMMSPDITEMRRNPTPEQIRKNEQGSVLKNPVTGKALIQYWPKIREIFGVVPSSSSNVAY